jgi:hypothetical protein
VISLFPQGLRGAKYYPTDQRAWLLREKQKRFPLGVVVAWLIFLSWVVL